MPDLLPEIYKKHKIWIEIVESFGCNKDTAEDIVMEMYIRIKNKLDKGLNIDYGEHDYNYYYVFKILKSMFLDLKRKEKKVVVYSIDSINNIDSYLKDSESYDADIAYKKITDELDRMYWYDKKVYELIDEGTSVANLSRKSKIPYHSLYNTYRKVIERLKNLI
jgi:DNA-directed RNA polymerase specialized sigma24 family protein|tara:strand:- start:101 stop:592 length:492 start_codon:yes stop_codon:yes gene_type:complete